jgi:lysylphosphatidylglycerol synthetase-like protein (DUF2156 family)
MERTWQPDTGGLDRSLFNAFALQAVALNGGGAGYVAPAPDPDAVALDMLRRHADHPSAFLAYNEGTRFYRAAVDGQIAYRRAGRRHLISLCGPMAAPDDRARLVESFRGWGAMQRRRITAVQLLREDAWLYARAGFSVNQLGTSYSIDLDGYTLRGTKLMKIRNKISRAKRAGVTVAELTPDEILDPLVQSELDDIDADWLRDKGEHELAFMIGERGGRGRLERKIFVARHDGRAVAYATYSPCFGARPGWLYDLTRRRPQAPTGTIEQLFSTALLELQAAGCTWLHLGLTPFAGLAADHDIEGSASPVVGAIMRQIAERGQFLYPGASQAAFKLKWQPQVTEPEYIAFDPRVSVGAVWHLLRETRTVALPPLKLPSMSSAVKKLPWRGGRAG